MFGSCFCFFIAAPCIDQKLFSVNLCLTHWPLRRMQKWPPKHLHGGISFSCNSYALTSSKVLSGATDKHFADEERLSVTMAELRFLLCCWISWCFGWFWFLFGCFGLLSSYFLFAWSWFVAPTTRTGTKSDPKRSLESVMSKYLTCQQSPAPATPVTCDAAACADGWVRCCRPFAICFSAFSSPIFRFIFGILTAPFGGQPGHNVRLVTPFAFLSLCHIFVFGGKKKAGSVASLGILSGSLSGSFFLLSSHPSDVLSPSYYLPSFCRNLTSSPFVIFLPPSLYLPSLLPSLFLTKMLALYGFIHLS